VCYIRYNVEYWPKSRAAYLAHLSLPHLVDSPSRAVAAEGKSRRKWIAALVILYVAGFFVRGSSTGNTDRMLWGHRLHQSSLGLDAPLEGHYAGCKIDWKLMISQRSARGALNPDYS
jgi:hypothetical protein